MERYILALDEGTTGVRSILFDRAGVPVACVAKEFTQYFPQPGYVEHDAEEIFAAQYETMEAVVKQSGIRPEQIAGIGITNQRETTVCWDKVTGKPVYHALVWQCRRTAPICKEWDAKGLTGLVRRTTGLPMDAYFSASKIRWILDHAEGAKEAAEAGRLLFGTMDCYLAYRLSGGRLHITDVTNASRTMLLDLDTGTWDPTLAQAFGIPLSMLPTVVSSSEVYGTVSFMGEDIPLCGMAGDQQAALFGQGCFTKGTVKNTYGTGCFLLMHNGHDRPQTAHGLIATVAATRQGRPLQYAAEGSVFVGGAVIQWLRDELGLIASAAESETVAATVESSKELYVVPAFTGLGAPYWDMYARGAIVGLTRGSGKAHIVRAALESIAYQTDDLIAALRQDTGLSLDTLQVDGGASRNGLLMQFQADLSRCRVMCCSTAEATARGAAFLAGLAVGFWKDETELLSLCQNGTTYEPQMSEKDRMVFHKGWEKAVKRASHWTEE